MCLFYLIAGIEGAGHTAINCKLEGVREVQEWIEWKGNGGNKLKLPSHGFCWFCGNPEAICQGNSVQSCYFPDTTLLICYLGWKRISLRSLVQQAIDEDIPASLAEFRKWVPMRKLSFHSVMGHKGLEFAL